MASAIRPAAAAIEQARRRLHLHAYGIVALAATSYGALVFWAVGLVQQIACAAALVVAVTAIGTGIMHDANHGAFCRSPRGNRIIAYSADLVGASSWVWRFKHNTLHHAHPNQVGVDSDIEQEPFARLAPSQPWHPWHRYQHLYLWILYGFLGLKWFFVSDFVALSRNGFGSKRFPHSPRRRDVALIGAGKLVHIGWAVAIPLTQHPWWGVAAFYLAGSWLVGFMLSMVFQLAHCTDQVAFAPDDRVSDDSFDLRQLRSTADIRCTVPVVGTVVRWLMGGLDHQIEHHLAPRLPHTLYPALARPVQVLCEERALPYHVHPSLSAAVRAHGRWLHTLGRRPTSAPTASAPPG